MIELRTVSKPLPSPLTSLARAAAPPRHITLGSDGTVPSGPSRSVEFLATQGKSGPISPPFESVIQRDDRVRILDTNLLPWRQICALKLRGPSGAGAIGTGWLVGPKTILTAGHCVYSTYLFGGWASSIEAIPGQNGTGSTSRPFGSITSTRFSSVDRWVEAEDADFDIGCIHLDEPLGEQLGWFAMGALPPDELQGYLVNVSGYPRDRGAGNEQYHHANRVLQVTERRVFYEVDTYGGQSGAPVWIHESDNSLPLVVGIHTYGIEGTPGKLNIVSNSAPRILPEVLDRIREWVDKDGGWPEPA